jgi:RNA polymerase sigma factor (sigma-70 family)
MPTATVATRPRAVPQPDPENMLSSGESLGPKDMVGPSELLRQVRTGDQTAWEEITRRYDRLVWARVRAYRLQDADASDAVQMTWLRLAENHHRLRCPERLPGWLSTTANRECLRILRDARRVPDPHDGMVETVADPSAGPEERVIDADTARELRRLVAALPPRGRALLQALFAEDPLPYAEVARSTGIPIGSMGPTRARALQQLRQMLDQRGLGADSPTTMTGRAS